MADVSWTFDGTSVDAVTDIGGPGDPDVVPGAERTWAMLFTGGTADTRHQTVLDYTTAARQSVVDAGLDTTGEAWFYEDVASAAPTNTVLVKFTPDAIARQGRWALVTGGEDATPPTGTPKRLEVTMVDLAADGAYANADAVRAALQVGGGTSGGGGGGGTVQSATGWTQTTATDNYAAESGDSVWMDGGGEQVIVELPSPTDEANVRVIGVDDTNAIRLTDNNGEGIEINTETQSTWALSAGDRINVESNGTYWEAV